MSGQREPLYNKANIVKLLLIHSTTKNPKIITTNKDLKYAYGFGVPDYKKSIYDEEDEVSILYCDIIKYSNKKHKIRFLLPKSLVNNPCELIFTLVYNPPIDSNFPKIYNMISLSSSIRFLLPSVDEATGEIIDEIIDSKPLWNWDNFQSNRYNVIQFKKKIKKVPSQSIELLTQMSVFEEFEKNYLGTEAENIFQSYALMLTIKDLEKKGELREEISNSNQFHQLIENKIELELG